jgi:hypothetical protein
MSTNTTVYLLLRLSATYVFSSETSSPQKPWYQLFDTYPANLPPFYPENTTDQCYASILATLLGREEWHVKIEYRRNGHETLDIVGWCEDAADAGRMLKQETDEVAGRYLYDTKNELHMKSTAVVHDHIQTCEYIIPAHSDQEQVWYWRDIVPVKLEPMKQYGILNPEAEKHRAEDMEWRTKEGLDMARRTKGEFTEQEMENMAEAKERMGVVEEEDAEDAEDAEDVEIIGSE